MPESGNPRAWISGNRTGRDQSVRCYILSVVQNLSNYKYWLEGPSMQSTTSNETLNVLT